MADGRPRLVAVGDPPARAVRAGERALPPRRKLMVPLLRRVVVNKSQLQKTKPELLDDGATIARRIIMLPNREEDMGAMYLRQMLWTLHENAGDGTATAAVLFQAIFNEGIRYISAGGNAMRLRHYLEQATPAILAELDEAKI